MASYGRAGEDGEHDPLKLSGDLRKMIDEMQQKLDRAVFGLDANTAQSSVAQQDPAFGLWFAEGRFSGMNVQRVIQYYPTQSCPIEDDGQKVFFFTAGSNVWMMHPDNVEGFTRAVLTHVPSMVVRELSREEFLELSRQDLRRMHEERMLKRGLSWL